VEVRASLILILSFFAVAANAQVYKCKDAQGRSAYSDSPCEFQAKSVDPRLLQSNTIDASGGRRQVRMAQEERGEALYGQSQSEPAPRNYPQNGQSTVCPTEQAIKNLETSANSIAYRSKDKRDELEFLRAEIRRARSCSKEGGSYTSQDWQRVKESQAAQGNLTAGSRQAARATAEAVHSNASSNREQDRMLIDRQIRAQRAADEENERERRHAIAAAAMNSGPKSITHCNQFSCTDSAGNRYDRGVTGNLTRRDGKRCQVTGNSQVNCW